MLSEWCDSRVGVTTLDTGQYLAPSVSVFILIGHVLTLKRKSKKRLFTLVVPDSAEVHGESKDIKSIFFNRILKPCLVLYVSPISSHCNLTLHCSTIFIFLVGQTIHMRKFGV